MLLHVKRMYSNSSNLGLYFENSYTDPSKDFISASIRSWNHFVANLTESLNLLISFMLICASYFFQVGGYLWTNEMQNMLRTSISLLKVKTQHLLIRITTPGEYSVIS